MFNSLSQLKRLNYCKVNHYALPAKPTNNPEFIYTGRKFNGRPALLEEYIKGGYRFSEQRKQVINEQRARTFSGKRTSLYPDCRGVLERIFGKDIMVYHD